MVQVPSYQLGANSIQKTITIAGSNFESSIQATNVSFGVKNSSFSIQSVSVSPSQLTLIVTVSSNCLIGDTTIAVTNPNGGGSVSRGDAGYFVIGAMPIISSITSPTVKEYGQAAVTTGHASEKFKIIGSSLSPNLVLYFANTQITPINPQVLNNGATYQCDVSIDANFSPLGVSSVTVINPDFGQYVFYPGIKINAKPTLSALSVTSVGQGSNNIQITITGAYIQNGCVVDFGALITTSSVVYDIPNSSFTVIANVDAMATIGARNVTITNPDLGYATQTNFLNVVNSPNVNSITPSVRAIGVISNITVFGQGPYFVATPSVWFSASNTGLPQDTNITIDGGVTYNSASQLTLNSVNIKNTAATGSEYIV